MMRVPVLACLALAGTGGSQAATRAVVAEVPTTAAVVAPAELAATRERLLEIVRASQVPSFVVGVVRDRQVVWQEGLGWADREARTPATPDIRYPVASVSKSITATGALALVASGELELDRPVRDVLREIRLGVPAEGIQVSHLLSHTSGIPHLWHYEYLDRPETLVTRQTLIRENAFVAAAPGERFLYSNLGYGLLAQVVEDAGAAPFQRVMERVLFEPLDMGATTVDAWLGGEGVARGYSEDGKRIHYRLRLAPDGGAGFFSSMKDLVRYIRYHLGWDTIAPSPRASMAAVTGDLQEMKERYRYLRGWGAVRIGDRTVLISDGEAAGGTAAVLLLPELRLGVAVLCNATGCPSLETAVGVLDGLIPGFGEQLGGAVGTIESGLTEPGVTPSGRFEGFLTDGSVQLAASLDFTDHARPVLDLGESSYLLQGLSWERGALQATVVGSLPVGAGKLWSHNLDLSLWLRKGELRGVAQENLSDERPRSGTPHLVVFKPVGGTPGRGVRD